LQRNRHAGKNFVASGAGVCAAWFFAQIAALRVSAPTRVRARQR
jgi:hypothetical protein